MPVIVDTTVWIDFFAGTETAQTDLLADVLRHRDVAIGDLILTEVLQGIPNERDYHSVHRNFSAPRQFNL